MKNYNDLTEIEQKIFISKLVHALKNFQSAYTLCDEIIILADKYKIFHNTNFGTEEILKNNMQ